MRGVLVSMTLLLLGPTAVQADDVAEPFKALAGKWVRPFDHLPVVARDGVSVVSPELRFVAGDKSGKLFVSGTPPTVYWNPLPPGYDLVVPEGQDRGVLLLVVKGQTGERKIRFEYTIEGDTLTIRCKEKVPAGPWLGEYDITGKWVRFRTTLRETASEGCHATGHRRR